MVASVGPTNAEMSAQRETDHFKAQLAEATKAVASTEKKLAVAESAASAAAAVPKAVPAPAPAPIRAAPTPAPVAAAAAPTTGVSIAAAAAAAPTTGVSIAAAAAPTTGMSAVDATNCALSALDAKTSYKPDIIEMDMNLEIGVDSIKRVEILSEVQKQLNVETQDVAALSRTQAVNVEAQNVAARRRERRQNILHRPHFWVSFPFLAVLFVGYPFPGWLCADWVTVIRPALHLQPRTIPE